jgi:hypothetical protein
MADMYEYSSSEQHRLARRLTAIMSCGVLASFVAGFVMDHVGPNTCQVVTLLLGQLQLLVLLTKGESEAWLTLAFVLYCLFRQFLFPTFIASITDKLGKSVKTSSLRYRASTRVVIFATPRRAAQSTRTRFAHENHSAPLINRAQASSTLDCSTGWPLP